MDEPRPAAMTAKLFGLPRYAPRLVRDLAGIVLVAVLVLSPSTFANAVDMAVERTTERITERLAPILADLATPDPAPQHAPTE